MYRAILFDMDGTVVDTENIWNIVAYEVLRCRNIELTQDQYHTLVREITGQSLINSSMFLKAWVGLSEDAYDLLHEQIQLAQSHYSRGIRFIPGFPEFHQRATNMSLYTALATNADRYGLRVTDDALSLHTFFGTHMYCVEDVCNISKPAPDIYQYVAQELGITPDQALVIEDSQPGIQAAVDAGAYCIGINTGGNTDHLRDAHYIVDRYDQIDLPYMLSLK